MFRPLSAAAARHCVERRSRSAELATGSRVTHEKDGPKAAFPVVGPPLA